MSARSWLFTVRRRSGFRRCRASSQPPPPAFSQGATPGIRLSFKLKASPRRRRGRSVLAPTSKSAQITSELATFYDWDAHSSEVICADLLVGANTLLPRRRRGLAFNLKLSRIPGVAPWEKAGGGG